MRFATIASTVVLASVAIGDPTAQTSTLPANGNLQDALNRARPGDTILLTRGATYVGNFTLPVKDGSAVITIRTAGDDGLPGEGQRMTPAAAEALAKIRSPNK